MTQDVFVKAVGKQSFSKSSIKKIALNNLLLPDQAVFHVKHHPFLSKHTERKLFKQWQHGTDTSSLVPAKSVMFHVKHQEPEKDFQKKAAM